MRPHINIPLAEGVVLPLPIAGLGSRGAAALIDTLAQAALLTLGLGLLLPLILTPPPTSPLPSQGSLKLLAQAGLTLWIFAVVWGYHVLFEGLWEGQTLGKRALALRVISRSGLPPSLRESALRNILRPIDLTPLFYGLGGLVAFLSPLGQRLGDIAAGTLVVHDSWAPADPEALNPRFRAPREARWLRLATLLDPELSALSPSEVAELAHLYRATTHDLAMAGPSRAGPHTQRELIRLITRARQHLFKPEGRGLIEGFRGFFGARLPQTMRRHLSYIMASALLILLPLGVTWTIAREAPSRAYSMAGSEQRAIARAHQGGVDDERDPQLSAKASAFYMTHNSSVALRAFAGGIAFGLGSAWALVSNGYSLGVTLALVEMMGAEDQLLAFVAAHLPWELLAIVMAGAGGLIMGASLLRPGALSRSESLAQGASDALTLALGAISLLVVAGVLEGSVSPAPIAPDIKYLLGVIGCLILISYGAFAGRERPASSLTSDTPR